MTIAIESFRSTWNILGSALTTAQQGARLSNDMVNKTKREKAKLAGDNQLPWSARADGEADFTIDATTTAAETGAVGDLTTTKGLSLKAGYLYPVRLVMWAQDGEDRWKFERNYEIMGGTTPVISGGEDIEKAIGLIAGAAVKYGKCHAAANFDSSDTAILTAVGTSNLTGVNSPGSSIGNIATNTAVLTHPIARATHKRVLGVNASADVATVTEILNATVFPGASSTTMSIFTGDTATPSADGFDDDGRLEVDFYIEPPPNSFLQMNGNNVECHVSMDASDNVRFQVQIFVGDPTAVPFIT